MNVKDVCACCKPCDDDLKFYIAEGVINISDDGEASDGDVKRLCVLSVLSEAGLTREQSAAYFKAQDKAVKAKLLRSARDNLLDAVHDKQKLIDKIDYLLYELR